MNIVSKYVKRFLSEAVFTENVEIGKIRDLIDPQEGSEFEVYFEHSDEVADSVDYAHGGLNTHDASEEGRGTLSIEKQDDGTWEWHMVLPADCFDLSNKEKGFSSLDECLKSLSLFVDGIDYFEVIGLA